MSAILEWRGYPTARRFAVWMAVDAAFFLGLAAGDLSLGTTPVPFSGWLEIAGLFLLMFLFVLAGTQRDDTQQK